MSGDFAILTVCTGNVCRSPLAEQLIAQHLGDCAEITVGSAGTHAMLGEPMSEPSQEIARRLGIGDPGTHVPRMLTAEILDSSGLILAMARDHRRAIVEMNPRVARRVFTIRGFARLAAVTTDDDLLFDIAETSGSPVERLEASVRSVTAGRALVAPPEDPSDDDVVDPYKRGQEMYEFSARQLVPAVESAVAFLRRALEVPL